MAEARAPVLRRFGAGGPVGLAPFGALAGGLLLAGLLGLSTGLAPQPLLPLAGLLACLGLAAAWREPELAAAAAVVSGVGRISEVLGGSGESAPVFKLMVGLLAALAAWRWLRLGGRGPELGRTLLLLLAVFGVHLLSAVVARDVDLTLAAVDDLGRDVVTVLLVATLLRTRRGLSWSVWGVIGLGGGLAVLTLYQGLTGNFSQHFHGLAGASTLQIVGDLQAPRASGPYVDPNFYGQYLLVFASLALFRVLDGRRPLGRLLALGALAACLGALPFTFSRGAFLALAVVGLVVVFERGISWRLLLAASMAVVVLQAVAPSTLRERLGTTLALLPGQTRGASSEVSFQGRLSETVAGLRMFLDHPLLGVGAGNGPLNYQDYAVDSGLEYRRSERATHNMFIELGAETGLLGLGLFLLLIGAAWSDLRLAARRFRRAGDRSAAGLADSIRIALLAFLAAGFFLPLAQPRGLWLLIALAVATQQVAAQLRPARLADGPRP